MSASKNTVKAALTIPRQRRARTEVENKKFAAFSRRILRAHAVRVGGGDIEALADLVALSTVLDDAIGDAVVGLRTFGYNWHEIAIRLGVSKQAVQQRWGRLVESAIGGERR